MEMNKENYTIYIDTHFVNLVLALFKDGVLIDKKVVDSNKHSLNTIPLFSKLLEDNHIIVDDIKKIIVINGPGSFTGVRIGIVLAKMLAYTKNIPVYAISYLQAMALQYHDDVIVGIKDRNGVFIGEFNQNHELVGDYAYLSNKEMEQFYQPILLDDSVDLLKIYQYTEKMQSVLPHLLKPLYVKKIEVSEVQND